MNIKSVCVIGALILATGFSRAQASTLDASTDNSSDPSVSVLYSQSTYVKGNAGNVTTLETPGAGELFLTLTDLDFPTQFASLDFSLSSSSTALTGLADPGTLQLSVTGPTTLYADVFASAQGKCDVGLYNLTATFLGNASPVPLPGSGTLLSGALLFLLAGVYRRRVAGVFRHRGSCLSTAWRLRRTAGIAIS